MDKYHQREVDKWIGSGDEPRSEKDYAVNTRSKTIASSGFGALPIKTWEQARGSLERLHYIYEDGDPRKAEAMKRIFEKWPGMKVIDTDEDTWGVGQGLK